jgi:hypothetical protein
MLSGTVMSRFEKRHAEDLAEGVPGVAHVQNNLRVRQAGAGDAASGSGVGSSANSGGLDAVSATGPGGGTTGSLGPAGGPGGTGSLKGGGVAGSK